jgi:large subunit ribosomal protein L10
MPRFEKELMVNELVQKLKTSKNIVVTNFNKVGMQKLQELRRTLRGHSAEYVVVKNSVAVRAFKTISLDELCSLISGTVGIVTNSNDPIGVSKVVVNFSKVNETFRILGGNIEGELLNFERIRELANLPSKEVLIGKLIGTLNGPVYRLYGLLNNVLRGLLIVLSKIEEQKSKEN